jgi:EmrB/QacA subfamily drug resistance transporter
MDSSMTNVALPFIMQSFGTDLPQTEWVVLVYLLTITVFLLFWGRVADSVGLHWVYLTGMLIFSVGSVACYLSATLGQLIVFRFVQAMGAAMMMATGPAIIKEVFPLEQLGKALGLIGVATSMGLLLGPLISGMLIHSYSWREIFLVTVPLSLIATLGGVLLFGKENFVQRSAALRQHPPFDWGGMFCWAGMISFAVLFATHGQDTSGPTLLAQGSAFFTFLLLLIRIEKITSHPLIPLPLFRRRPYAIAMFCAALSFAVLFVVLILMPFYLNYVLGLSPQKIGMVMMAVPIAVFFISPLSGRLYDFMGARLLTTAGLAIAACGLLSLCFLGLGNSPLDVVWRLALLGCGQALFLSPNSATVLANVSSEQTGVSSGLLATARNMGMLVGVSVAGLLFGILFRRLSGGLDLSQYGPSQDVYFVTAMRITFAVAAVFSVAGAWLSSLRGTKGNGDIRSSQPSP